MLFYTVVLFFLAVIICIRGAENGNWKGNWFPVNPNDLDLSNQIHRKNMGILNPDCDDAKTNLWLDYDPKNESHNSVYMCRENIRDFKPTFSKPVLKEYIIPTEYSALHKCMNETIAYEYNIPTFGTHRSNWPIYGEYNYVPPQRWLHALEHGGIVALYHPCVYKHQLKQFQKLIKTCLYRHVISAYEKLTADKPFALVAWGKSLEMSFIDPKIVIGFIRMNALQGPEKTARDGQYDSDLIEKAQIVSNINDDTLCPNM